MSTSVAESARPSRQDAPKEGTVSAAVPSTLAWSWSVGPTDGYYQLSTKGRVVAELMFLRRGALEHVAMQRVTDSLNRLAEDHGPSLTPTWWAVEVGHVEGTIPREFALTAGGRSKTLITVLWFVVPSDRRLAQVMRRILDGLDAGRGLPAVSFSESKVAK